MRLLLWYADVCGSQDDVLLAFILMFHIYGLVFFGLGLLCVGVTTISMLKYDFEAKVDAIQKHKVGPAEPEYVVLSHPLIVDAAVILVEDEETGQIPRAYVVRVDGFRLLENQVIEFVAGYNVQNLARKSRVPKSKDVWRSVYGFDYALNHHSKMPARHNSEDDEASILKKRFLKRAKEHRSRLYILQSRLSVLNASYSAKQMIIHCVDQECEKYQKKVGNFSLVFLDPSSPRLASASLGPPNSF
ncbi:hypothetical protein JHK87_012308 [Glycine soja]|nr:hypothetical protein JHK87_012308 [Glycine soja]